MSGCWNKRPVGPFAVVIVCRRLDYSAMSDHLNRKRFNRSAWCAAVLLVGSAATIFGAFGFLAK
jgi:hypothetical protein